MTNIDKIREKMSEKNITITDLADSIGIDRTTLHRKLKKGDKSMTVLEALAISDRLCLSKDDRVNIFFK